MVEVLIWLAMGGVVGWMTSAIMCPKAPRNHGWNVCLGMAGAVLAGWLIPPRLGMAAGSLDMLNMGALLVALVGAILLLAIANLFRRTEDVAGPPSQTAPDER